MDRDENIGKILIEALSGKSFHFGRVDGSPIGQVTLVAGGVIGGSHSPNERFWSVEGNKLIFRNSDGVPTTIFKRVHHDDGAYEFRGDFLPRGAGAWHTLTEIRKLPPRRIIEEATGDAPAMVTQHDDLQIYVATHKRWELPREDRGYVPMHVGKAVSESDLGIVGDDTGDNISNLNPYYCELTGLYWIWKNSHASTVGLVHYRRYFAAIKKKILLKNMPIASSEDFDELRDECDLIVPVPLKFVNDVTRMPMSNEEQYSMCTIGLDLALTREVLEQLDKSYVSYWDFVMRSNSCSAFNMFVGKKKCVDDYCEWLFEILFKLQDWIPYRDYVGHDQRVFGFLAERLFNVWIAKNRKYLRVRYRPFVMIP